MQAASGRQAAAGSTSLPQHSPQHRSSPGCCAGRAWLTIGIPTIPRKTGADYLTRTLGTLMEELPLDPTEPLYKRVRVLVMNNRPGNHTVFYKVRARLILLVPRG